MTVRLRKSVVKGQSHIRITGSKSESNRLLLLQALYPEIQIKNLSNSDDTQLMQQALQTVSNRINIHHAGTAMRFLTAFFAIQQGREITLTGSQRMQERPISILVEALKAIGADISYINKEGYPPLHIKGEQITQDKVTLKANVSSQYISALLLIAPKLENGLELTLDGNITSLPYIKMTTALLDVIGADTHFEGQTIYVNPMPEITGTTLLTVESDWSSASYFYSLVALSDIGTEITLTSYKKGSLQGDSSLAEIYGQFGVTTTYHDTAITLSKHSRCIENVDVDLVHAPDIAQTIAVTCLGLGVPCRLTGLHTLKIKETDRLVALKTEIEKFGTDVHITENTLQITQPKPLLEKVTIDTYNDHRMAMAFAPLALKVSLQINDADVVSKSYPDFWEDMQAVGVDISKS